MKKHPQNIAELNLKDASAIKGVRYFDGEIGFADDLISIPQLRNVLKVNFIVFVFCVRGNLSLKINGEDYNIGKHDAIFIDAQSILSVNNFSPDFMCKIIGVSTDIGFTFINKSIIQSFFSMRESPILHFSEEEMQLFGKYYELAIFKIDHPNVFYGKEVMSGLLRAAALDIFNTINKHLDNAPQMMRQGDNVFRKFILMLAGDQSFERSVKVYAARLYVTPKYLSSVCLARTHKTAHEIIVTTTVSRIKQQLLYSDKSIKEISNAMGFPNPSFFSKFVKQHLGLSPHNYRKQNGYGQ